MIEAPRGGFLDLPAELQDPLRAQVHVLPIPYEATVSYGEGTREGPAAIIAASHEVEMYEAQFDGEPCLSWGVHTMPALAADWRTPEEMMPAVAAAAEPVAHSGKLLVALGGEHSITPAIVRGVRLATGEPLAVVQIDAHADLRDSFHGTRHSHACAMRRSLEETEGILVQLGIRSCSGEEASFIRANSDRITVWRAEEIHAARPGAFLRQLSKRLAGRRIYLTIDVDGLDPSVVPATGTPEPDGLGWRQCCNILRAVAEAGEVVAMDCVELAPRPGLHASEFSVARLLYLTIAHVMRARGQGNARGTAPG
jgi:agmatinase